jgi:pyrimidine-nucleoside phosphorylase
MISSAAVERSCVSIIETIAKKRDRGELSAEEIAAAVSGFTRGQVAEAQMAALLMAIVLNGMSARESADLTMAMVNSGERLDLSAIPGTKVDKHSTGGVGDKTTLVVAPLVAALGVPVAKMSGRALGHTGGTIDKLEVIRGLRTGLTPKQFVRQVSKIGIAIAAQSAKMAPADKKIYALRDSTATVESIPLIASSVMSKKLAAGADAIVLDVKSGGGAFVPDAARASDLARLMVDIGAHHGKRMVAVVTRMEQPLGRAVGDAVELAEAVATLHGRGPDDLVELCEILAGHMLVLGGAAADLDEGCIRARQGIVSGMGLAKLKEMVVAQGGDPAPLDSPDLLTRGVERLPIILDRPGLIVGIDARQIGLAIRNLKAAAGEGRRSCGVVLNRKVGETAESDAVATLLYPAGARDTAFTAAACIRAAFQTGEAVPESGPRVAATFSS